jgi:hypothetical protein
MCHMTGFQIVPFFLSSKGPFMSNTEEKQRKPWSSSGSHSGGYEELFPLEYVAM